MLWHHWGCYWLSPLPLWIADQVRNDGVVVPGCVVSRLRGNDGEGRGRAVLHARVDLHGWVWMERRCGLSM